MTICAKDASTPYDYELTSRLISKISTLLIAMKHIGIMWYYSFIADIVYMVFDIIRSSGENTNTPCDCL